jgi:hypothetical protein
MAADRLNRCANLRLRRPVGPLHHDMGPGRASFLVTLSGPGGRPKISGAVVEGWSCAGDGLREGVVPDRDRPEVAGTLFLPLVQEDLGPEARSGGDQALSSATRPGARRSVAVFRSWRFFWYIRLRAAVGALVSRIWKSL